MMRNTITLLRGKLCVELLGSGTDRLLNACAEAGLPLWKVSFHNGAALHACLYERDLQRLEKIAALCQCEIQTIESHGGSGSARRPRIRLRLGIFAAAFALLLTISGLFIWDIEVVGNETLSDGEILRALSECGVSEGCFWPTADAERVRVGMLLRCDGLAWMTLNVRGSRATVLVLEREEKPEIYDENAAADLIASRSGVVRELNIKNGRALTAREELVTQGQTLVSGTMDSPTGDVRRVRAMGSVTAETWPERTIILSPGARRKQRENGFRVTLGMQFGKNRVNLVTNSRKELDECDKIVKEYTLGVKGLFRFPLGLCVEVYRPYRTTGAAAADVPGAEARALTALGDEIDGEVVSYEFEEQDEYIVLRAHCLENIAVIKESKDP